MNLPGRIIKKISEAAGLSQGRERIVVKTVEKENPESYLPGFIIGVYRSGTTLLRYVLDSHDNIAVPPETNFLNGIVSVWRNDWYRKGLQGLGVDEDGLRRHLRRFAGGMFDEYAAAKGKKGWFDKTPAYIDILDFLQWIFGEECCYIMLYRHGLDAADSMARMHGQDVNQGPGRTFATEYPDAPHLTNLCYWVEQCERMLAFTAAHPQQCFTLKYEEYATEPEVYLPPLFQFLGEEWDPEVLKFHRKQHDFGLQDYKAEESKGFKPNIGIFKAWPEEEQERAMQIAGPTLKKLGYLPP